MPNTSDPKYVKEAYLRAFFNSAEAKPFFCPITLKTIILKPEVSPKTNAAVLKLVSHGGNGAKYQQR
ncbi:unnamed protein product [Cyprideis torosa]|uniref:Uncharacterized protein n=1 Tax=Cyprideis torosa TaxID=163714 RepID=A0A7R8WI31_9CRUS|nr:unnamed protein product [Cyprideis torosa]CAG0897364.1 unnamed protein product [Cyprideis torosa]